MKISELIKELEKLKQKHGDIEAKVQSLSHIWEPELGLRPHTPPHHYVLLNA